MNLRKGQLVAVWSWNYSNLRIRIYIDSVKDAYGTTMYRVREAGKTEYECRYDTWYHCIPLEEAEPDVFIGSKEKPRGRRRSVPASKRQ